MDQTLKDLVFAPGSDLAPGPLVVRTVLVFVLAIGFARLAKKRFIAQASALDLMTAVVFGSLLSRSINGGANLISCAVSGFTLVLVHRALETWAARSPILEGLVKGHTQTLVRDGVVDKPTMLKHAVSQEDLLSEVRLHAKEMTLDKVALATLERSGHISVVTRS